MKSIISALLKSKMPEIDDDSDYESQLKALKVEMARLQQVAWMTGKRAVIVLEGFDAAGKGTCIRHLTELLDPRAAQVVPIGTPSKEDVGQHYLQRFWTHLPGHGQIVVFDRSWYGRVLVEKVEKLTPPKRIEAAYAEINHFEKLLRDDGIIVVKFFLVVSKKEQLKRFKDRLEDPFKNWKITEEDVRNRKKWDQYVVSSEEMIKRCPGWIIVPSDHKKYARTLVLKETLKRLRPWMKDFKPKSKQAKLNKLERALLG